MKRLVVLLALLPVVAFGQSRPGPLTIGNNLAEIAKGGSGAQAAAQTNLGLTDGNGHLLLSLFPTIPASQVSGLGALATLGAGSGLTVSGNSLSANVQSVFGRAGAVSLQGSDVTGALGFTPYNAANPSGFITAAGAPVQSVFGRSGTVTLLSSDVTGALGFTPFSAAGGTLSGPLTVPGVTNTGSETVGGTLGVTGAVTVSSANPVMMADGAGHNGAVVLNFPTRSALAAWQPTNIGASMVLALTAGFASPGDGGAAEYAWNASSSASGSDNFIIQPNGWAGSGRWYLAIPSGGIHPESIGLKCDGVTDDSTGMNNLVNFMQSNYGGGTITLIPGHTCYFASTVQIVGRTILRGAMAPFSQAHGGGLRVPDITLATGATLQLAGTKMEDVFVRRAGLANPPANMEAVQAAVSGWNTDGSIGVQVVGDDTLISDSEIVGFGKCIYSSGYQRLTVRNVHLDCANGLEETVSGDTTMLSDIFADNYWAYNLSSGHAYAGSAAVSAQGSGYTTGDVVTMSAVGATCTTLPRITLTVSGGSITGAAMSDVGDCSTFPANPVAVTGGTGSGATFALQTFDARYRPGIGIYLHDQVDGGLLRGATVGGYQTAIKLSNVWEMSVSDLDLEPEGGATSIGLATVNCVSETKIANVYAQSIAGIGISFAHKASEDGGSCAGQANGGASVLASNLSIAAPLTSHNVEALYLGPYSRGAISNLQIGGPGYTAGSSVVIGANVRGWQINGVLAETDFGATSPLYTIDPTSSAATQIISTPAIISLTTGATLTAQCNQTIYVNDATAPTITLPATCPIGQDVIVKDIGGQAAAHTITLTMPGGSTLDGAASQTITTNYGKAHVQYNGLAAALN